MTAPRVALIGYGLGGEAFHAPFIAAEPRLDLTGIVVRNAERRARAERRYPSATILSDAAEIWAQPAQFDAVVITSPNWTHEEFAFAAIEAGLAVVIDKPMATSSANAEAIIDAAHARGVPLTVFQSRRWDGDYLTLASLIDGGRLGQVRRFESRFERWAPVVADGPWEQPGPENAGGLLFDLGSHLIDQALRLFGPAGSVYAQMDVRRAGSQIDDDTFVALTHLSGVRSHLWMNAMAADLGPRMRVLGERGAYVKHGLDIQEELLVAGHLPAGPGWGEEPPERWGRLVVDTAAEPVPTLAGRYQDFYRAFAGALVDGAPLPVDPRDAVAALTVIEAAVISAAEGRVVPLV